MDILTQGLLGGVLAQSIAKKGETKFATIIGFVAGLLADADIFISSSVDPLLNIEFHRHFSHSIFFIPFGAAIAALLLWPFFKKHLNFPRIYLYAFLGYSMSGLLDACTSYGTHLFWPISDERIAFNIISIIDPIFTLSLLVTLIYGLRLKSVRVAHFGLLFAAMYMLLGYTQSQRATSIASELIASRGHDSNHSLVKPTLANNILWRSIYIYDNRIYVDAIRLGVFTNDKIFQGSSVKNLSLKQDFSNLDNSSVLYKDLQRFRYFSNNYIAFAPNQKNVISDLRYSMLPMSTKPLWGIIIDKKQPEKHARFKSFRDTSNKTRKRFLDMLLGEMNETL